MRTLRTSRGGAIHLLQFAPSLVRDRTMHQPWVTVPRRNFELLVESPILDQLRDDAFYFNQLNSWQIRQPLFPSRLSLGAHGFGAEGVSRLAIAGGCHSMIVHFPRMGTVPPRALRAEGWRVLTSVLAASTPGLKLGPQQCGRGPFGPQQLRARLRASSVRRHLKQTPIN